MMKSNMQSKAAGLLALVCLMPLGARAQSMAAPTLHPGDTWTYTDTVETGPAGWRQTRNEIDLERVTGSHVYYTTKPAGSTQAAHEIISGADWSRERSVDGNDVVVNQPLNFPLENGKRWKTESTDPHPNARFSSLTYSTQYRVVGYEDVQVKAGTFHALKIEAEGSWSGVVAPGSAMAQTGMVGPSGVTTTSRIQRITSGTASGRTYKAFWYAPEVGRWVKSVEEYYGSDDVRTSRYTSELDAYKRSEG